ncbi:MAG: hypothetical protein KDB03_19470 [Planctomycetales bacterium]|nr:hypothetical protein [Planctomycetales bacterium]
MSDSSKLQRRVIPTQLPNERGLRCVPAWLLSLGLHCVALVTVGLLWVGKPHGTGGNSERPIGIAVVYEAPGGEAYYLSDSGTSALGNSQSTTAADAVSALPSDEIAANLSKSLLSDLLPDASGAAGGLSSAAGGLGLGDGGAQLGGDRSIPKVKTSVFGVEGEGRRFIYVFDRSQSMDGYNGRPLRIAKQELLGSLESLSELHQFQIVFYNDTPYPLGQSDGSLQMLNGNAAGKEAAKRFVQNVTAVGSTQHILALRMALRLNPDVIFFLTDGDRPALSGKALDELRVSAQRSGATIHSIQFGSGPNQGNGSWIAALAEGTYGKYRYIDISIPPAQ